MVLGGVLSEGRNFSRGRDRRRSEDRREVWEGVVGVGARIMRGTVFCESRGKMQVLQWLLLGSL